VTVPQSRETSPSLWLMLKFWLSLGTQSFGGGTATLALIRREVVDRNKWMDDSEFVKDWALCQISPGINLLGMTILLGRRLGGTPGIAIALFGLLFPSTVITVVITAFYAHFKDLATVRAALHGVIPATVGLGLLTAFKMVWPLLQTSKREGGGPLAFACALAVGAGLAVAAANAPVVLVLCAAGGLGALFWHAWSKKHSPDGRTP